MNCPNCKAAAAEGAKDCPACGIVFEKWARRQAEKDLEAYARRESGLPEPGAAGAAPAGPAAPPAAPSRALRALKWAGGALLLWLILPASLLRVVGLAPKTKALSFTATDLSGQKMRLDRRASCRERVSSPV